MQRVLLAVLLARANRAVSAEVLREALWDGRAPRSAGKVLQVYVHRLRRALGEADRIAYQEAGYSLVVRPGELDATRFAELRALALQEHATGALSAARDLQREALGLWRGTPFGDLGDVPVLRAEIDRLQEQRLAAYEECMATELALGNHSKTVGELAELVDEYPLRERLRAQLMLALHRTGRRADALRVFDTGRRLLADDLGIDPSRELRDMHTSILRDLPVLDLPRVVEPPVTVPRQLPADISRFTGRGEALRRLDEVLPGQDNPGISTISGAPGAGKTALALRWAHRSLDRFPDGQLYINLRGCGSERPLRPVEALAQFLRALGVAPLETPLDVDEAAALFRSLVARRTMLILLDNAASVDQVRPLLPGGPGCVVVVTSRDRLTGLVAEHGARRLLLDGLPEHDAVTLVARVLGPERVGAEPEAVARLCRLCEFRPLALRIAATHLLDQPELAIAAYAGELESGDRIAQPGSASAVRYAVRPVA
nr:transcriptional regulator [Kibdelosporangium phytohabitans]